MVAGVLLAPRFKVADAGDKRPTTAVLFFGDEGGGDPPPCLAAHTIAFEPATNSGSVVEPQIEFGFFPNHGVSHAVPASCSRPARVTASVALARAWIRRRRIAAVADSTAPSLPLELQSARIGRSAPLAFHFRESIAFPIRWIG